MAEKKSTTKNESNDPDVLVELSRDATKSTYRKADANPDGVTPAPGPSVEQTLGKP
jgi:hypothetical protein